MNKGKLIVFEGGEGSGKTTLSIMAYKWCLENNIKVIKSREPGGTEVGEDIRNILLKDYKKEMNPLTELLLYEAVRREHYLEVIKPALDKGINVILDRFILSTMIIQGYKLHDDNLINTLNHLAIDDCEVDYTFILDIDPKTALNRIKTNNRETNRFDNYDLEFHEYVRKKLLEFHEINPNTSCVINTNQSALNTFDDIKIKLAEVFKNE